MKLNEQIIARHLSESYKIYCKVPKKENDFHLKRPYLLSGLNLSEKNRIFIVKDIAKLPKNISEGSMFIICSKKSIHNLTDIDDNIPLIFVKNSSVEDVLNTVQRIFDYYSDWELKLGETMLSNADLKNMVEISYPIFKNSITIFDQNLNILSKTKIIDNKLTIISEEFPLSQMYDVIGTMDNKKPLPGPFFKKKGESTANYNVYGVNLFHESQHVGSAVLIEDTNKFQPGDFTLFQFFCEIIQKAIIRLHRSNNISQLSLRNTLEKMIDGESVSQNKLNELQESDFDNVIWQCIIIDIHKKNFLLPVDYVCSTLEGLYIRSVALYYKENIVYVFPVDKNNGNIKIKKYLKGLEIHGASSAKFKDLKDLPVSYKEALSILELQNVISKNDNTYLYEFEKYKFLYMLDKCTGDLPLENLLPIGLQNILIHDSKSKVNYWETLKIYLDNDENISLTARELFVHRSTLIQRIKLIEKSLGEPLKDPMWRLQVRLCMTVYERKHSVK